MGERSEAPSAAELEILRLIFKHPEGIDGRRIHEGIGKKAYTTTHTLIQKLIKKGLVEAIDTTRRPFLYQATLTEEEFQSARAMDFGERYFGGNLKSFANCLVSRATRRELDLIQRLIEEEREKRSILRPE